MLGTGREKHQLYYSPTVVLWLCTLASFASLNVDRQLIVYGTLTSRIKQLLGRLKHSVVKGYLFNVWPYSILSRPGSLALNHLRARISIVWAYLDHLY
jgi:hypothetical protein